MGFNLGFKGLNLHEKSDLANNISFTLYQNCTCYMSSCANMHLRLNAAAAAAAAGAQFNLVKLVTPKIIMAASKWRYTHSTLISLLCIKSLFKPHTN